MYFRNRKTSGIVVCIKNRFSKLKSLSLFPIGQFFRWYVRVFDGNDNSKEGWVPATILNAQPEDGDIFGDRADDAKYRRE